MRKFILAMLASLLLITIQAQPFRTVNDLSYAKIHDKQKLDLYLPQSVEGAPTVLWIHGGAWAFGDRKNERDLAEKFVRKGIAVAVMSYRLSPGTWADPRFDTGIQHPEHIRDVASAFSWLYQHASEYGYSKNDIFVSGYSAGGHLSALLATDPQYLKAHKLSLETIKGVIPIAGAYDIAHYHDTHYRFNGPDMANKHVKAVFGDTKEDFIQASPTHFVQNLEVPMFLISENQSYKYTKIFEDTLKKNGKKDIQYLHVRELDHKGFYENLAQTDQSKYRDMITDFIHKWSADRHQ